MAKLAIIVIIGYMIALKDLRLQRGISRRSIAQALNWQTADICQFEQANRFPKFITLVEYRRALGIDIKTFYERLEQVDANPAIAQKLRSAMQKLQRKMPADPNPKPEPKP